MNWNLSYSDCGMPEVLDNQGLTEVGPPLVHKSLIMRDLQRFCLVLLLFEVVTYYDMIESDAGDFKDIPYAGNNITYA